MSNQNESNTERDSQFSFSFSLSRDLLMFLLGFLLASGGFTLFIYFPQKPSNSTSPKNSLSFSHLGEDLEAVSLLSFQSSISANNSLTS